MASSRRPYYINVDPSKTSIKLCKAHLESRHIFYANTTVLTTQGACREAGGGLMGLDALQGGQMRMGWDGMGEAGRWGLLMMRQTTGTPSWDLNPLFLFSPKRKSRTKSRSRG